MRTNLAPSRLETYEGGTAKHINPEQALRRAVMACLLWETSFYESGEDVASRIAGLVPRVDPENVANIAIEGREKMKLRHVPLLVVREMLKHKTHKPLVAKTLERVIQRPDEMSEFLALYWKDKRTPIAAQVKRGLAAAFTKFNEYSLAKYNQGRAIKLRDVLFLSHAKPKNEDQAALWKRLIDGALSTPDTWEVELSASKDKKASWERLLSEDKLFSLALLRNLRNITDAGVDKGLIKSAILKMKTERVLPFRFITAARHAPYLEQELEQAMFRCLEGQERLVGSTLLLIDNSFSMYSPVSGKSEIQRIDAACGLAMLLREICEDVDVLVFSDNLTDAPPRRGFALKDAVQKATAHEGTQLGAAIQYLNKSRANHDRIIVITDEQSADAVPDPKFERAYMINVAAYQNGVGYGKWTHIDGWSEAIVDYVRAAEASLAIP